MQDFSGATGSRRRTHPTRRSRPSLRPTLERLEGRDLPAPLAPTGLMATGISASAISLAWNASTDPAVAGYNVYEKVWIPGIHNPRGSGGTPGHYVFNLLAVKLTTPADIPSGLKPGTTHDYVVTAVGPTGQSAYSADASAETWIAPIFPNGPNTFLLSSGALWSGTVNATAGLTTQLSLLVAGNPLKFSVASGPSSVSIDPKSGVVTFKPAASEVGGVNVTFKASNPLGAITQTIAFNVVAPAPNLATPTLRLSATTSTYTGQYQPVSASAVGKDGVTAVGGTFAIAYDGGKAGYPHDVGTYPVLVTFTSSDPRYGNATLLTTFTITKASPAFANLASPTIAVGTATTTISGTVAAGTALPTGDTVVVTLNGVSQAAKVDANGNFSTDFATGALPVGNDTITYAFAGDANFNAAPVGGGTLKVIPTAPPHVTLNPRNVTTTDGDSATFTATATGSPVPAVQWQVSIDGGKTFTSITGNASATTTTLIFHASLGQNGYKYRAVFTSSAGSATTSIATLTVESDNGGN